MVNIFQNPDSGYIQYPNASFSTFASGFGAILFAFGGASTFPTIQNDMKNRAEFWKSVVVAFIGMKSIAKLIYFIALNYNFRLIWSNYKTDESLSLKFFGPITGIIKKICMNMFIL